MVNLFVRAVKVDLNQIRKMSGVAENLNSILAKVTAAYEGLPEESRPEKVPRLVAVSKTKPIELIIEAYNAGQRHFGENYIQEICEKSVNPELLEKCPDLKWHFIGNCQSNKVPPLMKCPNLCVVETVTSQKLASKLNNQAKSRDMMLSVMVQINTSGEENKNGLDETEGVQCGKFIKEQCANLNLLGLMTIGNLGNSLAANTKGENPDFTKLIEVRKKLSQEIGIKESDLELSMGMSNDFEEAIRYGSTNVRVGSSIFGARNYPAKPNPDSDPAKPNPDTVAQSMQNVSLDAEKK
eukprot:TRINITY_DN2402_c0_g1_i2.p1 TRINITY_DN2402_c0_g1~~TRINITY_DN2402_c0_g1_i2.p1  ORF type:complete len:296 (-),score=39.91 TRINITY_DN2402_c0_g1_i2:27-914(-)